MRHLLAIIAALTLLASPASAQTMKALMFNSTNGNIVYDNANTLTFTNTAIAFSDASNRATTRTNLGLGATWLTNTDVNSFRAAINLGTNNDTRFAGVKITNALISSNFVSITPFALIVSDGTTNNTGIAFSGVSFSGPVAAGTTRTNLGLGATWLTNTNATNFKSDLGFSTNLNALWTSTNAENARNALELGVADSPTFDGIFCVEIEASIGTNYTRLLSSGIDFSGPTQAANTRTNLGLPLSALTNTSNVTTMRALGGSTNTNEPYSGTVALTNTNVLTFSNGVLLKIQ